LDFQGLLKSSVWPWLAHIPRRVGFAPADLRERGSAIWTNRRVKVPPSARHVVEKNLELLRAVGVVDRSVRFCVEPPAPAREAWHSWSQQAGIDRYLILNPGGGWSTKRWHPERFAELGRSLLGCYGGHLVLTGGPMDRELLDSIRSQIGAERVHALVLEIRELWAAAAAADLFVGGDTGPLHFAVALGTPVVGLYGPTDPARNGPLDPRDAVVWHELWCSRCYRRRCPYHWECMESIQVDEVLAAVKARLTPIVGEGLAPSRHA
jgi:ADP-heptose:LPS heptosyltransferase